MSETEKPPTLRDESTPEGRAFWESVREVGSRAPEWARKRIRDQMSDPQPTSGIGPETTTGLPHSPFGPKSDIVPARPDLEGINCRHTAILANPDYPDRVDYDHELILSLVAYCRHVEAERDALKKECRELSEVRQELEVSEAFFCTRGEKWRERAQKAEAEAADLRRQLSSLQKRCSAAGWTNTGGDLSGKGEG